MLLSPRDQIPVATSRRSMLLRRITTSASWTWCVSSDPLVLYHRAKPCPEVPRGSCYNISRFAMHVLFMSSGSERPGGPGLCRATGRTGDVIGVLDLLRRVRRSRRWSSRARPAVAGRARSCSVVGACCSACICAYVHMCIRAYVLTVRAHVHRVLLRLEGPWWVGPSSFRSGAAFRRCRDGMEWDGMA